MAIKNITRMTSEIQINTYGIQDYMNGSWVVFCCFFFFRKSSILPSQYYFHTTLVLFIFAFTCFKYSYLFRKTNVFISEKAEASKLIKEPLFFIICKHSLLYKYTMTCC